MHLIQNGRAERQDIMLILCRKIADSLLVQIHGLLINCHSREAAKTLKDHWFYGPSSTYFQILHR